MFKRFFWLSFGYLAGITTSFWVFRRIQRRLQDAVARYAPAEVRDRVGGTVVGLGTTVRASVGEGRQAMREREAELHRELDERRN